MCTVEIESFGYTMSDLKYAWNAGDTSVQMSQEVTLPQFKVLGHRQRLIEVSLTSGNYSRLLADVVFTRDMGYYLIQVLTQSQSHSQSASAITIHFSLGDFGGICISSLVFIISLETNLPGERRETKRTTLPFIFPAAEKYKLHIGMSIFFFTLKIWKQFKVSKVFGLLV